MEKINVWCRLVSTVSIISSLFSVVIPESTTKKAFNTLLSIIMVFTLLHPLNSSKNAVKSFSEKINDYSVGYNVNEISDYSHTALIDAAQGEIEKHIKSIVGECNCQVICSFDGEAVKVEMINIEGDIGDKETADYYNEIKNICGDSAVIEFNGERYE